MKSAASPPPRRAALKWLYSFLLPQRGAISRLALLSILATGLALLQPWFTKLIIDDGLLAADFQALLRYSLGLLLLGVCATILSGYNRIKHTRLSGSVLFALREDVYAHLQKLPPTFFSQQRSGDLVSRLDRDVAEIQRFAVDTLFSAFSGVVGLLGTCALMLMLSWQLSLVLLAVVPLELFYLKFMRPKVERRNRQLRERGADISSFLTEKIPAIKFIQSAGGEEREQGRLSQLNQLFLGDLIGLQKTEFFTAAVPRLLLSTARASVFLLGGYWVIQGQLALGSLIAFSAYLGMATGPVQSLLGLYMAWQRLRVSLDRVSYLRQQPLPSDSSENKPIPADLRGDLALNNVYFKYEDGEPIFTATSLVIPAGCKAGIHGCTGSGKSTLLDLIQRHLQPQQGCIEIDGLDIAGFDPRRWREQIAVVPQDPVIFRDSLADNIRYSVPDASAGEILAAAQQAGLTPLLEKLPRGMDTMLGERGSSLSGGERQRIALARALLQKPLLLLLDEPTSAVDATTEAQLITEIDRLFADTTRLVISHRPSTLQNADLMVTIESGELRVTGRTAERLRNAG
ncbi:MAG: ABC transporter ATP-binding protein [Gammaproteobacteria bacterium]|nr:ABC transporter ATP-binding protein [Gammaproteobacteria bacterium]